MVSNFYTNNYIEYESNGVRKKTYQSKHISLINQSYQIKPYLK